MSGIFFQIINYNIIINHTIFLFPKFIYLYVNVYYIYVEIIIYLYFYLFQFLQRNLFLNSSSYMLKWVSDWESMRFSHSTTAVAIPVTSHYTLSRHLSHLKWLWREDRSRVDLSFPSYIVDMFKNFLHSLKIMIMHNQPLANRMNYDFNTGM